MKLDLATLCYTVPGLRWLGKPLTPSRLFRISLLTSKLSLRFCPHTRRFVRPLEQLLRDSSSALDLNEVGTRYLAHRRYMNYLEKSWHCDSIHNRLEVEIRGQAYLDEALRSGRGAVLLSGHAYGFNRLVGPVLSRRGYSVIRPGMVKPDDLDGLMSDDRGAWNYLYLGTDRWQRLRALKTLSQVLNRNGVVHILVVGQSQGDPRLSVQLCGQPFYLMSATFDLIAQMNRPVLPCFALGDLNGKLTIEIHRSLPSEPSALALEFTKVYESYLREAPEFVRFWRRFAKRSSLF